MFRKLKRRKLMVVDTKFYCKKCGNEILPNVDSEEGEWYYLCWVCGTKWPTASLLDKEES